MSPSCICAGGLKNTHQGIYEKQVDSPQSKRVRTDPERVSKNKGRFYWGGVFIGEFIVLTCETANIFRDGISLLIYRYFSKIGYRLWPNSSNRLSAIFNRYAISEYFGGRSTMKRLNHLMVVYENFALCERFPNFWAILTQPPLIVGNLLNIRPVQIFRYTLSPGTCLQSSGQVRSYGGQVPLLFLSLQNWKIKPKF